MLHVFLVFLVLFLPPLPQAGEGWGEGGPEIWNDRVLLALNFTSISNFVIAELPSSRPFSRLREKGLNLVGLWQPMLLSCLNFWRRGLRPPYKTARAA